MTQSSPDDKSRQQDTPRTDAECRVIVGSDRQYQSLHVQADFARKLERELADAEWKAAHRLEMFNQREQLIRDLQTAAMRTPSSTAAASNVRNAALEEAAQIALRRTEIPRDARKPTRDQVVIVGEEIAALIRSKKTLPPSATASALPADVVTVLRHARMYIANRGAFRPYQSMLDELHEVMERHGLNGEKANG